MKTEPGILYLLPSPLGEGDPKQVIPSGVMELLPALDCFFAEELRTVRRYLSKAGLKGRLDSVRMYELNEHTGAEQIEGYMKLFDNGNDVALVSEAGLPAVADPGAQLVALAHERGIEVVPAVGPSSLMLALMASGLNGQNFAFCGYLPAKSDERRSRLKAIEKVSAISGQTQIFIETPYRNDAMLKDILEICHPMTRLCIAADLTLPEALIRTKSISEWKKTDIAIGKRPCVFLLLAGYGLRSGGGH